MTDVFDSELEDAGGLNNEGLQLEVTDRGVASRHHVAFVPEQDEDVEQRQAKINLGQSAADAGLEARLEDGEVEIPDGEFEAGGSDEGGGGFFADHDHGAAPHADDPEGGDPEHLLGNFGRVSKLSRVATTTPWERDRLWYPPKERSHARYDQRAVDRLH